MSWVVSWQTGRREGRGRKGSGKTPRFDGCICDPFDTRNSLNFDLNSVFTFRLRQPPSLLRTPTTKTWNFKKVLPEYITAAIDPIFLKFYSGITNSVLTPLNLEQIYWSTSLWHELPLWTWSLKAFILLISPKCPIYRIGTYSHCHLLS